MATADTLELRDMRRLAKKLLQGYADGVCPSCNVPIDDHAAERLATCARAACGLTSSEIVRRCEVRRVRRAA